MRTLFVNKYLYPKGGSETHLLMLADALGLRGHDVEFFGMEHPSNATPPERTTTVPSTNYGEVQGWGARAQALGRMLYSTPTYRTMRQQLQRSRPDVAHLHNIYHQLSPSVLVALREAGVPCVLTAHDYKLVCPSYSLHDGESQCFACQGHRYWNVLRRGCSRRGVFGDIALAAEATVHHFLRLYERNLDAIIAPSRFVRDRLVEGGFEAGRVRVLPNSISVEQYTSHPEPGEYMLFVGRLSYEKGLPTLLAAIRQIPHVPLRLVGDGPLRGELEHQSAGLSHVRFLGSQPQPEVRRLLEGCRALVLPSQVPENCPLSVLEAFASGKPAIATRVGGVPELVEPGLTGLTVPPGDPSALAAAMCQLWDNPELCWQCGVAARQRAESQHNLSDYIRRVEAIYGGLTGRSGSELTIDCAAHDVIALPFVSPPLPFNASTGTGS